jgi:hypothetical protein
MGLRVGAALIGLVGGLAWISVFVFDRVADSDVAVNALAWTGLILVVIAALGAGASLVSRSTRWLRVLVAVCFSGLVVSILELLLGSYDDQVVFAVFGAASVVASVVALTRSDRPKGGHADTHRGGGTHAR